MLTRTLCRLFIKDGDNLTDPRVRLAYGRLAGIVGIVLIAAALAAYIIIKKRRG